MKIIICGLQQFGVNSYVADEQMKDEMAGTTAIVVLLKDKKVFCVGIFKFGFLVCLFVCFIFFCFILFLFCFVLFLFLFFSRTKIPF